MVGFPLLAIGLCIIALGCSSTRRGESSADARSRHGRREVKGSAKAQPRDAARRPVSRPAGLLTRSQAEKYILDLINRDRAKHGLAAVQWDPTAARAGQRHADDMARHGFTAHWGTDGSVPELRYTEAGGVHMVQENAGCFADAEDRPLEESPRFDPEWIDKVQSAFINETPPHDGHRRNILTRWHTHVGVGLAQTKGIPVVCVAQEFVDNYGAYSPIPQRAKPGQRVRVEGSIGGGAEFAGIAIARTEMPRQKRASDLLRTGSYAIPKPFVTYFPKGFVTPIPVEVHGNRFAIEVPVSDGNEAGLYEVSVWGKVRGKDDLVMTSLRTVRVQ